MQSKGRCLEMVHPMEKLFKLSSSFPGEAGSEHKQKYT